MLGGSVVRSSWGFVSVSSLGFVVVLSDLPCFLEGCRERTRVHFWGVCQDIVLVSERSGKCWPFFCEVFCRRFPLCVSKVLSVMVFFSKGFWERALARVSSRFWLGSVSLLCASIFPFFPSSLPLCDWPESLLVFALPCQAFVVDGQEPPNTAFASSLSVLSFCPGRRPSPSQSLSFLHSFSLSCAQGGFS